MGNTALVRAELSLQADMTYVDSDHLAPALIKYYSEGIEALDDVEKDRVMTHFFVAKSRYDAFFYQYELGLLDDDYYRFNFLPSIRYFKPMWEEFDLLADHNTRPSFKAVIESVGEY